MNGSVGQAARCIGRTILSTSTLRTTSAHRAKVTSDADLGQRDIVVSAEEIPHDVRSLIHDHIESVVQLEALLLLQARPQQDFPASEVGKELRIEQSWAAEQLNHLCARGFAACLDAGAGNPPVYRYGPRSVEMDRAIHGLAQAYADRRVSVITLIFSKPADKLRSFTDAFKLRRDNPRG